MAKGKGLKGALARHNINEAYKKKIAQKANATKEQKESKLRSMKSGNTKTKRKTNQQFQKKSCVPFNKEDKVLLVGEGDFSFTRSIIEESIANAQNLVATSYESKEELEAKYPNFADNLEFLESNNCQVKFEIDATKLVETLKIKKNSTHRTIPQINTILFNFPHTGHGIKDQDRNIREHQLLLQSFFKNCNLLFKEISKIYSKNEQLSGYLSSGSNVNGIKNGRSDSIIVSLFEGEPYQSWNIKMIAKSEKYLLERSSQFIWDQFPTYHHRRTNSMKDTTKPAAQRNARIYKFTVKGAARGSDNKSKDLSDDELN